MGILLDRSPVGIRTPPAFPSAPAPGRPSWYAPLLKLRKILAPNATQREISQYRSEASPGQLGGRTLPEGMGGVYARKLQREQATGLTSRSVTPLSGDTRQAPRMPWPSGNRMGPRVAVTRSQDIPRSGPQSGRLLIQPRPDPYGQILTAQDHHKRPANLVPVSGGQGEGLDYGPPPWRIPFVRRSGLSLMASSTSFGFPFTSDGLAMRWIIAHFVWSDPTRGTRAASGIKGRVGGNGRGRVPAFFVPREVR